MPPSRRFVSFTSWGSAEGGVREHLRGLLEDSLLQVLHGKTLGIAGDFRINTICLLTHKKVLI
jgi:hypothetical protein